MKYTDDTLMAFVDGEVDATLTVLIEADCARDAELAARVERQRRLRTAVRAAFDGTLLEPVPDRLLGIVRGDATAPTTATVVGLAEARASRAVVTTAPRRWSPLQWGAMAASVALGVVLGSLLLPALRDDTSPIVDANGRLIARGALAQALSTQPSALPAGAASGSPRRLGPVRLGPSLVAKDGAYCRSFVLDATSGSARGLAGLACRQAGEWRLAVLAEPALRSAPATDPNAYRQAAADLPPAVLSAIDAMIQGSTLDAQAERDAIARGWQR